MRTTLRTAAALAVLLLALAACGGSGHSTTGSAAGSPPTAVQVAKQIGATSVQEIKPTLYAYTEATATWNGRTVDIVTFRTAQLQKNWEQAASQFTGIVKHGDLYTITDG